MAGKFEVEKNGGKISSRNKWESFNHKSGGKIAGTKLNSRKFSGRKKMAG